MVNIVTFSGWGQSFDSLDVIAPKAKHINYTEFENIDSLFESIGDIKCDVLIGWSLGGQLALRAIDEGIISPKLLVLIAAPFQFIVGKGLKCGVDVDSFNVFESEFEENPVKTLQQFSLLIAKNDSKAKNVLKALKENSSKDADKWLYWLEELRNFTCQSIDFTKIPKTIAIHGRDDTIIDVTQTSLFRPLIENYKVEILEQCGHAPHLHDNARVSKIIQEAI